jgi:replicative DNA helicase
LPRQVETRRSKIPELADLRTSGTLDQDATVVLFLRRKNLCATDAVDEVLELPFVK